MTTVVAEQETAIAEQETKLEALPQSLNKFLKQKLKGKTLLIGNTAMGEVYKACEDCDVLYMTAEELQAWEGSVMKYHNVVTHNFDHLLKEVQALQMRCEKMKLRFIAFKDA